MESDLVVVIGINHFCEHRPNQITEILLLINFVLSSIIKFSLSLITVENKLTSEGMVLSIRCPYRVAGVNTSSVY